MRKRREDAAVHLRVRVASVILLAAVILAVALHAFVGFDFAGYRQALADPAYKETDAHFPALPASGLRPLGFSIEPQMLQGGGHYQLLCAASQLAAVWDAFKKDFAYTSRGIGGHFIEDGKDLAQSLPLTSLMVDGYDGELGGDWLIGVVSAEKAFDFAQQPWNHGRTRGIAINEREHLVLYWCERW